MLHRHPMSKIEQQKTEEMSVSHSNTATELINYYEVGDACNWRDHDVTCLRAVAGTGNAFRSPRKGLQSLLRADNEYVAR